MSRTISRRAAVVRRQEILDASADLFRRSGYQACSMQNIADAVGILKGSLYHYFPSKDAILAELLEGMHQESVAMLADSAAHDGRAIEKVRRYLHAYLAWLLRHIDRVEIFQRDYVYLPPTSAEQVAEGRREIVDHLGELIVAAQGDGDVAADLDARMAANVVFGTVNWVGQWYQPLLGRDEEAVVAQLVRQALCGLAPPARRRGVSR